MKDAGTVLCQLSYGLYTLSLPVSSILDLFRMFLQITLSAFLYFIDNCL